MPEKQKQDSERLRQEPSRNVLASTRRRKPGAGRPRQRRGGSLSPLAINLDRVRLEFGLTIADLRRITGVSRISQIVAGIDQNTKTSTVERIASGLSQHTGRRFTPESLLTDYSKKSDEKDAEEYLRRFLATSQAKSVRTEEIPMLRDFPWPYEVPEEPELWLCALEIIRGTKPDS